MDRLDAMDAIGMINGNTSDVGSGDSGLRLRVGNGTADVIRSVESDELSSSLCIIRSSS